MAFPCCFARLPPLRQSRHRRCLVSCGVKGAGRPPSPFHTTPTVCEAPQALRSEKGKVLAIKQASWTCALFQSIMLKSKIKCFETLAIKSPCTDKNVQLRSNYK